MKTDGLIHLDVFFIVVTDIRYAQAFISSCIHQKVNKIQQYIPAYA